MSDNLDTIDIPEETIDQIRILVDGEEENWDKAKIFDIRKTEDDVSEIVLISEKNGDILHEIQNEECDHLAIGQEVILSFSETTKEKVDIITAHCKRFDEIGPLAFKAFQYVLEEKK